MTAAPPPGRQELLHTRSVTCKGFRREDGLFEIEGLLVDTKPFPLRLVTRDVPPDEPVHQLRIRMTFDGDRRIVDVHAFSEHTPYPDCAEVEALYRQLIGRKIEPGFTREIKQLFRGVRGCSHMTELLSPMASTIFQILWANQDFDGVDEAGSAQRTSPLGGCHALRVDGNIVKTYFSQHAKKGDI